jgi:diacylglycerol kinase (ATP)
MTNIHHHEASFTRKRLKSFKYAFRGFWALMVSETNARIHLITALLVALLGYFLNLNAMEWCLIVICISAVIAAEAFNTSIEKLADHVSPNYHRHIKKVKDLSAAGVLVVSVSALIIGGIIFVPKIIEWVNIYLN